MSRFVILLTVTILSLFVSLPSYGGDNGQMALVSLSVANLRSRPAHSAELSSQLTMGTPVNVLKSEGAWREIESPDGYRGWIHRSSIIPYNTAAFERWLGSKRMIVTSLPEVTCYLTPEGVGERDIVSDLVNGCIVQLVRDVPTDGRVNIVLPDGRNAWVDAGALEDFDQWATQAYSADKIVDMAMALMGRPYLWGGTSTKALDCSGLTRVCHFANGLILMRDASQQAKTGKRIKAADTDSLRRGDLLFFGNGSTGRVTHVALYDDGGRYVHCSERVKVSTLSPADSHFASTDYLHAVRIHGYEGSDGISKVIDHPWYFNQVDN